MSKFNEIPSPGDKRPFLDFSDETTKNKVKTPEIVGGVVIPETKRKEPKKPTSDKKPQEDWSMPEIATKKKRIRKTIKPANRNDPATLEARKLAQKKEFQRVLLEINAKFGR